MQNANLSIVDEVEAAIKIGSAANRLDTAKRVTDLFLLSAGSLNSEQIDLFDEVLERLVKTIEIRAIADISARIALAEMSAQLAPVARAPRNVIRRLARNDEISVAAPVLAESARLRDEDLVEIAGTKSEAHLLAISSRWWLKEIVTDALLARRYPSVSRRIIKNPGAGRMRSRTCRRNRHPDRFAVGAASRTIEPGDGGGSIAAVVACATPSL